MNNFDEARERITRAIYHAGRIAGNAVRRIVSPHHAESQYLKLVKDILQNGVHRDDRTGVGTSAVFGRTITHDMRHGFPLLTTRKVSWKNVYYELRWFLLGETNVWDLHPSVRHWWTPWADKRGNLGPTYGEQLRHSVLPAGDQLSRFLQELHDDPMGRRHILTTWNAHDLAEMRLPPCHGLVMQFFRDGEYLDMTTYQRSVDTIIGYPNNLASYALLMYLVAWSLDPAGGIKPRRMTYMLGDTHIYDNHVEAAKEYLTRSQHDLPRIVQGEAWKTANWQDSTPIDRLIHVLDNNPEPVGVFSIEGYNPQPSIKLPVAV